MKKKVCLFIYEQAENVLETAELMSDPEYPRYTVIYEQDMDVFKRESVDILMGRFRAAMKGAWAQYIQKLKDEDGSTT